MRFSNKTIEMCEWLLKRQMRLALPLLPSTRFSIVEVRIHSKQKKHADIFRIQKPFRIRTRKTPEINTHARMTKPSKQTRRQAQLLFASKWAFILTRPIETCMHIKRQCRRSSSNNDPTAHIFYSIHSNVSQRELSIQWQQNIAADDDLSV